MSLTLERMIEDRVLAPMSLAFAHLIRRTDHAEGDDVVLAAACLNDQMSRGHACLDLASAEQLVFPVIGESDKYVSYDQWPDLERWLARLQASDVVGVRDTSDDAVALDRPLVLDAEHHRLYLARYWFYQQRLARQIAERISAAPLDVDEDRLAEDLRTLFPKAHLPTDRDQCLAAANAIDQRFNVITGGPGTGKTTTVAKLLALRLMNSARHVGFLPELRVALAAPTGKAAQRLNEALGRVAQDLSVSDAIKEHLATVKASTIHRLLGWTRLPPERGGPFTYSSEFPLPFDIVLIDEASMVDLGLMWRLFDATDHEAQIILMGDRDQLASVEAGGVMADLCGDADSLDPGSMTADRRRKLHERTGLELDDGEAGANTAMADHVVPLRFSHRFDADSGLGRLAQRVRIGDTAVVEELSTREDGSDIEWIESSTPAAALEHVVSTAADQYREYLARLRDEPNGSSEVLDVLQRFRVLCAHREGVFGETQINRRIAKRLEQQGWIDATDVLYFGCPIMVTSNDYQQRLFNGDIGVLVRSSESHGLAGLFEDASQMDGCRRVPAPLLPPVQSCYAMTIHKSQGSEFYHVLVVLPHRPSPILSRELFYTAITRTADEVDGTSGQRRSGRLQLVGTDEVVRAAITNRIRRTSGLRQAIERNFSTPDLVLYCI